MGNEEGDGVWAEQGEAASVVGGVDSDLDLKTFVFLEFQEKAEQLLDALQSRGQGSLSVLVQHVSFRPSDI